MSKHTPGPWRAIYVGSGDWDLSGPVTQEDWKLAATAPDLLEALRNIADCCDEEHAARDYASRQAEIRGIARAAIAKAEGAPE